MIYMRNITSRTAKSECYLGNAGEYVRYGFWLLGDFDATDPDAEAGLFFSGYETADVSPARGSAEYLGRTVGIFVSSDAATRAIYGGNMGINVDFDSGDVTGGLRDLEGQDQDDNVFGLNDVDFVGSIDGANTFSGAAAVLTGDDGPMDADAAGNFNGQFFGFEAEEVGANWSLRDGAGNVAFGVGGASREIAAP